MNPKIKEENYNKIYEISSLLSSFSFSLSDAIAVDFVIL